MLQVVPKTVGEFEIYAIEWQLFDVIICHKEIQATKIGFQENQLKFLAIMETGNLNTSFKFSNQDVYEDNEVFFSEIKSGSLKVKNTSKTMLLKNGYVTCSHPLLVNFENTKLFDTLARMQEFQLPIEMRMCLEG